MDSQHLVLKSCPKISSTQNPNVSYFRSSFRQPSPSWSCNQCPKKIFLKIQTSAALHRIASSTFKCRNSVEKEERTGVTDIKKKLAVFVSGGGSNFRSIHQATLAGSVFGDVVVLVTNKLDCGGAEYARDKGIPVILFPNVKSKPENVPSSIDLVTALREYGVDFIILAGFLKLIPSELIRSYPRSILNIHPSLLPAFGGKGYYGIKVHEGVIASGARYSGPTVHFVDENYDTGASLLKELFLFFLTTLHKTWLREFLNRNIKYM